MEHHYSQLIQFHTLGSNPYPCKIHTLASTEPAGIVEGERFGSVAANQI